MLDITSTINQQTRKSKQRNNTLYRLIIGSELETTKLKISKFPGVFSGQPNRGLEKEKVPTRKRIRGVHAAITEGLGLTIPERSCQKIAAHSDEGCDGEHGDKPEEIILGGKQTLGWFQN